MREAGSYERLREEPKDEEKSGDPSVVSLDNESGIGLEDINVRNREEPNEEKAANRAETVV